MLSKRSLIVLLVGMNLLLLVVLVIGSYSMPPAFAQAGGKAGNFVAVTAKAQGQAYDVLYVLDAKGRKLHAFYPTSVQQKQYAAARPRDLEKDFER